MNWLQLLISLGCRNTHHSQSLSDISTNGSYTSPDSLPYPNVDCIQECLDTPVPDGILQKLAFPQPILKKDVPPQSNAPGPQSKPRLSLKRTSKVYTSPDTISHEDSPVPSTASGDIYCGYKCTPPLSDSEVSVSNEVETCMPSPVTSLDLNDVTTCSSEVKEALFHVESALSYASHVESVLSHACDVLYEHSIPHDIKLHPPDKISFSSPQFTVSSASPKSTFDKVAPVQHGGKPHTLCPTPYTGKKEKHLSPSGNKARVTTMLSHLYPLAMHTDHHYCQAKA